MSGVFVGSVIDSEQFQSGFGAVFVMLLRFGLGLV